MTDQLELGACGHTTRLRSYATGHAPSPPATSPHPTHQPHRPKGGTATPTLTGPLSAVCWPTDHAIARRAQALHGAEAAT